MDRETMLHKEIDLIQSIISRMANNSFLLKGWLISLIAIFFALTIDSVMVNKPVYFGAILSLIVIVFWYLDAFFVHKEKCYRELYNWVIENRKNTDNYLYNLNCTRFEKQVSCILKIMFSKTLCVFYGSMFSILAGFAIYKGVCNG